MTFESIAWVETARSAQIRCIVCRCGLTGGVDTFGALHAPQCQSCWLRHGEVTEVDDSIPSLVRVARRKPQITHTIELGENGEVVSHGIKIEEDTEYESYEIRQR